MLAARHRLRVRQMFGKPNVGVGQAESLNYLDCEAPFMHQTKGPTLTTGFAQWIELSACTIASVMPCSRDV
jgi:hypothetical protein